MSTIATAATVLATGGVGGLFASTTNPPGATGDGLALAWEAGAELTDLEFMQFHPTVLYIAGGSRILSTEAIRGEGIAVASLPLPWINSPTTMIEIAMHQEGQGFQVDEADRVAQLPQPPRAIVTRMLRNLIGVANDAQDPEAALRYVETVPALNPDSAQDRLFKALLCYNTRRAEEGLAEVDWIMQHPEGFDLRRVEELRAKITPQILRRLKTEVATDLPPKIVVEECRRLPLSTAQRNLYARAIDSFKKRADPSAASPFKNHLGLLHYLRLVCTDPRPHGLSVFKPESPNAYREKAPKLDWLLRLQQVTHRLEERGRPGEPQYRNTMAVANCHRGISGRCPILPDDEAIEEFEAGILREHTRGERRQQFDRDHRRRRHPEPRERHRIDAVGGDDRDDLAAQIDPRDAQRLALPQRIGDERRALLD